MQCNTGQTIVRDYVERLRSLVGDGYRVLHATEDRDFYMSRLSHRSNGNRIVLCAHFRDRQLWQKTNQIVTFQKDY